jgi:hypothetical protein
MSLYKLGEEADFEFIFIDATTNQPIDVDTPTYQIVYYVSEVAQIVVPTTSLVRVGVGTYTVAWVIPMDAVFDTYFVQATGVHPVLQTSTVIEESFQIVADDYFGQSSGLVIKFTKD